MDEIDGGEEAGRACSRGRSRPRPGEPGWSGPEWDDPELTRLARRLRDAHRLVTPLPADTRRRLIRHLLAITDLAKRDPALAARRLETFLVDFDRSLDRTPPDGDPGDPLGGDPSDPPGGAGNAHDHPADVE